MLHPAWPLPLGGRSRDRNRDLLQAIADTLGCPVATLIREAGNETYPDDAAELVRLWFKIDDPSAKQAIFDHARQVVEEK